MGKIGDLFVELGVKSVGQATLKDFIKDMGAMRLASLGAGGALATVAGLISGSLISSTNYAVTLRNFAAATGLSTKEMQKWTMAAEQLGVSGDTVASAIAAVQKRLVDMRLTGDAASRATFWKLGVNAETMDPFQVLNQLFEARNRMKPEIFSQLIGQLGLPPEMAAIFAAGRGRFEAMGAQAGGAMDPAQMKEILKMMEAYRNLWLEIRGVSFDVASNMAGPLGKIADAAVGLWRAAKSDLDWENLRAQGKEHPVVPTLLKSLIPGMLEREVLQNSNINVTITGPKEFVIPAATDLAAKLGMAEAQITTTEAQSPAAAAAGAGE